MAENVGAAKEKNCCGLRQVGFASDNGIAMSALRCAVTARGI
jgi:hypothetical protein